MDLSNIVYAGFDLCAFVLMSVVIVNYYLYKHMNSRTAVLFQLLCAFGLLSSLFNALFVLTYSVFVAPLWLARTFEVLGFVCFNGLGIVFFLYVVSIIYENKFIPVYARAIMFVVSIGGTIVVAAYVTSLFVPDMSESLFRNIVYGANLVSIAATLVFALVMNKRLRPIQRLNTYLYVAINTAATVIQMFVSWIYVSNFALAIVLMLIYTTMQHPRDAIDPVSGLYNQRTFMRRGASLIRSGMAFTVMVVELANFGVINSTYGESGGNRVIKNVATNFRAILPKNFYLYRLDGVRFAVIFNNRQEAEGFVPLYRQAVEAEITFEGDKLRLSSEAVLIDVPEVTSNLSEIIDIVRYYRNSEKATDEVINADRSAIESIKRRERVDYAIRCALENRSFEMYYQPIWSVEKKCFNCCEALIRLKDPELGFIPPDEFIPIAEQNGRIVAVGRFVVEEVCRFIKERQPERYGIEFIDVNFSVIQCMHPEIVNDINETLRRYGIPRKMFNLEVTETASAQSYSLLQSKLNELHSHGFTISLDDFGTGFATVEYLIKFPFDVVKLDKSLVWAYMSTKKYEPILQHYMPMLHSLGAQIVAEGVETIEMVEALEKLGCDYLQGFYYSRPIDESAFIDFVRAARDVQTA